jgi:hypothetical protein
MPVFFSNNKRPPPDVRRAQSRRNNCAKLSLKVTIIVADSRKPLKGAAFNATQFPANFRNAVSSEPPVLPVVVYYLSLPEFINFEI